MKTLLLLLAPIAALAADAPAVRIELVTGGHAHEISCYSVFEGNRDFKVNVNPHPGAFHSDLRKSTDVHTTNYPKLVRNAIAWAAER